jgi:hypothetical protein
MFSVDPFPPSPVLHAFTQSYAATSQLGGPRSFV